MENNSLYVSMCNHAHALKERERLTMLWSWEIDPKRILELEKQILRLTVFIEAIETRLIVLIPKCYQQSTSTKVIRVT